ncbi:MAG: hypothetical protein A4S09_10855 [Proteobacteria bacterium SG_bin7]|nr:MAG: hypothetical protein A4S09_10855 [Proteobacteria bacterium SG_bin7]
MYKRDIWPLIKKQVELGKSILLLGPRQVGKTTLCRSFKYDLEINLASIPEKLLFEKDPGRLEKIVQNLEKKVFVYIDEIQKIPRLFNSVQVLIDNKRAQFVLTGSSARKIRQELDLNYAPGRLINFKMNPLSLNENPSPLDEILTYGQLPAICAEVNLEQKEIELRSYVENYIEEEIRKETRLRSVAPFSRFIELAAIQSGKIANFSEISKELGPSVMTIQNYYQILEDTLFAVRVEPYTKSSSRKKLTKSSRYLFFDLGVRRILAEEPEKFSQDRKGELFEHFVGNEILKWINISKKPAKLYFWRDPDGPEVDWIIEYKGQLLPIEVKLKAQPDNKSIRHLKTFMTEYRTARQALVVSTTDVKFKVDSNITVISYQDLHSQLNTLF